MESISAKNYRSILDSGEIRVCPLTVIVGKNSAGKSSFVRLLPLLKQTLERKISDTLLWYGDYVDFGDYLHTVSKKRMDEPIEIGFSIMTHGERVLGRYLKKNDDKEFLVNIRLVIREKYIEKVFLKFFDQCVTINMNSNGNTTILINGDENPLGKKRLYAVRETGNIIPTFFESVENGGEHYVARGLDIKDIVSYCKEYIYVDKGKRESVYNLPFYKVLDFEVNSKEEILERLKKVNATKFNKMNVNHKRFQKINNYIIAAKLMDIIEKINTSVSNDLKQTSYLKPIRAMVNRYYRVQGISIDELDADGSNLPMILKNMTFSELRDFESWSKEKFGVIFSVALGEGHISLIIKNEVGGAEETNVADTGYGYSQMLPIVMLLWMIHSGKNISYYDKQRTIVIEQPELHLHPAYQAKMIDVFVNVINEAEKNGITIKIIFETHSETMVNRIGTLISENKIKPEKVNVLIFDKNNEETIIESKKFDEDGLLLGWPIGFFATEEE